MFKVFLLLSLLISSAYGQGTYTGPSSGQEPIQGPMRSTFDGPPGGKMITIADLDSTFVKTVGRVGNTLQFTFQNALNQHEMFSYTPDVGVTGAYLRSATANSNQLSIVSVDAAGQATTITFAPPGGGSGITGTYVSDASASGNTLTLTRANADGSTPPPAITFSPSGGISGPYVSAVTVSGTSLTLTITETDGSTRPVTFSATPGGTGLTAQDRLEIQDLTSSRFHTGGYVFGQHYPREFFFDQQNPPLLRDVALRNNRLFAVSDEDPPRYAFLGAHTPLTIPGHQTNEEIRGFTFTETYAVEVTNQRVRQFTVAANDQVTAIGGSGAIDKEHIISVASPPTGDVVYVAQRFDGVSGEDDGIQITRYNLSASGPSEAYNSEFALDEIQASVAGEGLASPTSLDDVMVIEATADNIFLTIRTRYEIIQTAIDDTGTGFEFDAVAHHKGGWLESVVGALRTPLLEYVCTPYVVLQYDISPDAPLTAEDYRVIFHDGDGPPLEPPTNAAQIAKDRTGKLFPAISRHIRHSSDPTMTTTNIAPINGLVVYWRGFNGNLNNNGFFTWVTDSNRFWQRVQGRNSPTSWSTVWQRIQGLDPSEDYRSTIYLGHFTSIEAAINSMSNNSTALARYASGANPSNQMAVYWIDTSDEQLKRVTGFTSGTTTEEDELIWGTHPLTQDEINVLISSYDLPPSQLDATNTPTDGQVPTYSSTTQEFTWRDLPTPGQGGLNEAQVDARVVAGTKEFARTTGRDITEGDVDAAGQTAFKRAITRPLPSSVADTDANLIYGDGAGSNEQRHLYYRHAFEDTVLTFLPSNITPRTPGVGESIYGWSKTANGIPSSGNRAGGSIRPEPDNVIAIAEIRAGGPGTWSLYIATDGGGPFATVGNTIVLKYAEAITGDNAGTITLNGIGNETWQSAAYGTTPRFPLDGREWDFRISQTAVSAALDLHDGDEVSRIADVDDVRLLQSEIADIGRELNTIDISSQVKEFARTGERQIQSDDIEDGTIGNSDVADDAITGAKVAAGTLEGSDLANNAITGPKVAAGTLEGSDLADDTVTGAKVAAATLTGSHLVSNTIGGREIEDESIDTDDLLDLGVEEDDLDNNSVTSPKIQDRTIQAQRPQSVRY